MVKIKKMQKGGISPKPTYKNLRMGVNFENNDRETKPTKQDSMAYEAGYNMGRRGSSGGDNERSVVKMGRWEGQNVRKEINKPAATKKPVVKKKNGGSVLAKSKLSLTKAKQPIATKMAKMGAKVIKKK